VQPWRSSVRPVRARPRSSDALAGLDRPTHGEVWLDSVALGAQDEDALAALRARLLGFVFQSFQLLPALTAHENVMLPLELAGGRRGHAPPSGSIASASRGGGTHYPKQLSGGSNSVAMRARFAGEPKF
jgi:putative ABC transport system ATP-binding protein